MAKRLTRLLWPLGWVDDPSGPLHRFSQWLRWPWRPKWTAVEIAMGERKAEEVWLGWNGKACTWVDAQWSLRGQGDG